MNNGRNVLSHFDPGKFLSAQTFFGKNVNNISKFLV